MRNKKIIISANVLFTIANFRKEFIKFLKENSCEVVCVASDDNLSSNAKLILKRLNVKIIDIEMSRKGLNPIKDLKYLYNLYKIYKQEQADYVFHFTIKPNIYGTIAAKFAKVKSINTINGLGSALIRDGVLSKILKFLYKNSLQFSTKVFFQNEDDKSFFINNGLVDGKKVSIVPGSGVDTDLFSGCESHTQHRTFLLVARLLQDKGIYEYIEAVRNLKVKYKNIQFLLAGPFDDGNPSAIKPEEVAKWEKLDIIKYLGKTDNIKEFLSQADVVVLPSYREGLSRFLIEAASASKPIITTDVAGCKDIVENEINGLLCNVKDSISLEKVIEKMILLSKEELLKMGRNSKKIAQEKFDKDIVNRIYFKEIT